MRDPPTPAAIVLLLEDWLQVEFTFYRVEGLADDIARQDGDARDFLLDWIRRVASVNVEVAWQFARRSIDLVTRMDRRLMEAWAMHAMDAYDRAGLREAMRVIERVGDFAQLHHEHTAGVPLEDIGTILGHFVHGLSGRRLAIKQGDGVWTDSETIFLPPVIARMPTAEDNFRLAKALVAVMWAQTRFGTFRVDLDAAVSGCADRECALAALSALETLRLEACIARELPGLHRDMQGLRALLDQDRLPEVWSGFEAALRDPRSTVETSLALLGSLAGDTPIPECCFDAPLRPESVNACLAARVQREKMLFRVTLAELAQEHGASDGVPTDDVERADAPARFDMVRNAADDEHGETVVELTLDGLPLPVPEPMRQLMTSIELDLGGIPPEYLVAAGPGEYDPSLLRSPVEDPDAVWKGAYHEEGAVLVPEWDFRRQTHRKNWCAVRERDVAPVHDGFVTDALAKHRGIVSRLKRTFEAMRDETRLLKRQMLGDGIDIDALVEAIADTHDGQEMTERLFTRLHRAERDIAVAFLIDMSGSTKGWINDAERETLALLCEALERLGDRYAIYGFSGITRKRCELFRIKRFDEAYDATVRARISGIRPQEYTRMGFAIRRLTEILGEVEARTRLLIAISDGKPDDYHDGYRGQYGVEDTRQALFEARRKGIRSFCITIDREARDYLPHMYGAAHYVIIDDVRMLPAKVPEIYRRMTAR